MPAPKGENGREWEVKTCNCACGQPDCCSIWGCSFFFPGFIVGKIAQSHEYNELPDACNFDCDLAACAIFTGLGWVCGPLKACYSGQLRKQTRAKYQLRETCGNDCCQHFWCPSCSLCQEYIQIRDEIRRPNQAAFYETHRNSGKQNNQGDVMDIPVSQNPNMRVQANKVDSSKK